VGLALTVGSNPTLSGWDENFSSTAPRASATSERSQNAEPRQRRG
jgi:hypothetical protein